MGIRAVADITFVAGLGLLALGAWLALWPLRLTLSGRTVAAEIVRMRAPGRLLLLCAYFTEDGLIVGAERPVSRCVYGDALNGGLLIVRYHASRPLRWVPQEEVGGTAWRPVVALAGATGLLVWSVLLSRV
jgi:hypothetical protein